MDEQQREVLEKAIAPKTGDIQGAGLRTAIPEPLAVETPNFMVTYGIRLDDNAMVFHFVSARNAETWDPNYQMDKRLERAIPKNFKTEHVTCGFEESLDSFFVIVGYIGASLDPWTLCHRFLNDVQAPL